MISLNISQKFILILFSLMGGSSLSLVAWFGYGVTGGMKGSGMANRLFTLMGGNFIGGGYIQWLTYIAFFWAIIEIFQKLKRVNYEKSGYGLKLLPTSEKHLLLKDDVTKIHFAVMDVEEKQKFSGFLTNLIKKACQKFRSGQGPTEMMDIVSVQTDINKEKSESEQSNIRYLTWVIPSIGFIGTILGIGQALEVANSGDMNVITSALGVAFDTTLVSLVLSIIVMWFYHQLQEETDKLHASLKEYVIENLINRIEL